MGLILQSFEMLLVNIAFPRISALGAYLRIAVGLVLLLEGCTWARGTLIPNLIGKKTRSFKNSSALSCYGKNFLNSNKRGKIKVQPTAVARKVKKKMVTKKRRITKKSQHNISKIIDTNEPAAKKSGALWYQWQPISRKKNPSNRPL